MIVSIDIDAQKTFSPLCPDELPVPEGDMIVPALNAQAALADFRVMTKDAHSLFAKWLVENRADMLQPTGLPEADTTWVAHAIVGSKGYELLDGLPSIKEYDYCVWKGVEPDFHPYGACFHDIGETLSTGLLEWLRSKNTEIIIVGGLATDYCVKKTVLQLLKGGCWEVIVNMSACRGLYPQTVEQAWKEMINAGALVFEDTDTISRYIKSKGTSDVSRETDN